MIGTDYYAFGEALWDCLPAGRHAGGAPLNVAAHLAQLGASASLISAVGADALGDDILQIARAKGIDTRFVHRARAGLPTGTVQVTLDAQANASYEIVAPVAWDEIAVAAETVQAVGQSRALVFGSLAARLPHNLASLGLLLDTPGPTKFFDVNLRPPFGDPAGVLALAKRADILKLNNDEAALLARWVRAGSLLASPAPPGSLEAIGDACAVLARATGTERFCVTRGALGAAWWERGMLVSVAAPHTVVRDTIGAGDAFMAGLMLGVTRGDDTQAVLEHACRLGAYVASQDGATPPLPPDIVHTFGGK